MDWLASLPEHLLPPRPIVQELDAFRESMGCPPEPFGQRILGSGWAIRRTLRLVYEQAKSENPTASEVALARVVYDSRQAASQLAGDQLPPLPVSCTTFDAVADFIVKTEAENALPDEYGWGKKIDSILARA